jgi:5-methylcytosine-specific restriction endonuclease McrA
MKRLLSHTFRPVKRRAVFDRDQGVCYLCGTSVSFFEFHVDHVVPISRGGLHTMFNIATACSSCNRRKFHHLPPLARVPAYARSYVEIFLGRRVFA